VALLVFSHANSFPAATYGVLFKSLRSRGFLVKAVPKFGHDQDYPVTDNWPHLVRQLHDFAEREVQKAGEPAFLVGHSLGGFLSLMCAARHPGLARGVLLLDSPLVLHDYVTHCTHEEDGQCALSFDRDVETAIYNTLPDNLGALLRRHPLKCPVAFIGGIASEEMKQVGMAMTLQVVKGRLAMLDGSHLFPMEKPLATAAAMEAALRNLGA
jgi:pimeloyl-ACP methyl ester carboxylesterase